MASINLFSSSVSWEGSLSENKPLCLKRGLQFNFFNFCLSVYISLSSSLCFSPTFHFTPLFFPCHFLPSLCALLWIAIGFSPVCLSVTLFFSPTNPVAICCWGKSEHLARRTQGERVLLQQSSLLIKPCIVSDNPSGTIWIFRLCSVISVALQINILWTLYAQEILFWHTNMYTHEHWHALHSKRTPEKVCKQFTSNYPLG